MQTVTEVSQYLSHHHIRPSFQRVQILKYLAEVASHPTIDEIYHVLAPEIPTLSKTTVYNTIDLFVRENIVQPLSIEENQMRYDADTSVHGHFMCERCGKIYDFSLKGLVADGLDGFLVESRNVFFKGICPACGKDG